MDDSTQRSAEHPHDDHDDDADEDTCNDDGNNSRCRHCFVVTKCSAAELRRAAEYDDMDRLQLAVQGWTIQEIDNMAQMDDNHSGKSALHLAAWKGRLTHVEFLLNLGCNINAIATGRYCYGKTPIFFAATRNRNDVVEYLLDRGAVVIIVNNKGQSLLSIAASHLYPHVVAKIQQCEQKQQRQNNMQWLNFRASHSDGFEYGDLDPRFLDRPLRQTDVVTDLVVNPTTKSSRKGAFLRRNPNVVQQQQHQQSQKEQRKSRTHRQLTKHASLTQAEKHQLDQAWIDLEHACSDSCNNNEIRIPADALITMIRLCDQRRQAWIPQAAQRLTQIYTQHGSTLQVAKQLELLVITVRDCHSRLASLMLKLAQRVADDGTTTTKYGNTRLRSTTASTLDSTITTPAASKAIKEPSIRGYTQWFQHILPCVQQYSFAHLNRHGSGPTLALPQVPCWIDSCEGLDGLEMALAAVNMIALDTEWCKVTRSKSTSQQHQNQPLFPYNPTTSLSLLIGVDEQHQENNDIEEAVVLSTLQIGIGMQAWVVDVLIPYPTMRNGGLSREQAEKKERQYRQRCRSLVQYIFQTKVVLTFAFRNDLPKLQAWFEHEQHDEDGDCSNDLQVSAWFVPEHMSQWQNGWDVQTLFYNDPMSGQVMRGLQSCVNDFSKLFVLNKQQQCSDWGQRPLSKEQLVYAGLDAVVLFPLAAEQLRYQHSTFRTMTKSMIPTNSRN